MKSKKNSRVAGSALPRPISKSFFSLEPCPTRDRTSRIGGLAHPFNLNLHVGNTNPVGAVLAQREMEKGRSPLV